MKMEVVLNCHLRLLLPLMCRPLMRCIKTAAKHATPVIKERMAILDNADEKGLEPELPVSEYVEYLE